MVSTVENKSSYDSWEEWVSHISEIPCAAYAILKDEGFTLLGCNQEFYHLLQLTEDEVRVKCGGRLGAIMEASFLKNLPAAEGTQKQMTTVKQCLKRGAVEVWLQTGIVIYPSDRGDVLCCVSTDITEYEHRMRDMLSFEETIRIAAVQADLDYFSYDYKTKTAIVRSDLTVLPDTLIDANRECPEFIEKMIDNGIIHPEYVSTFCKAFLDVKEKDGRVTCELRIKHNQRGPLWVKLNMALGKNKEQAVGILEDISNEKETASSYLNETQFYQVLLSEKAAYAQINVTEDKITRIGGMWNLYNEIIDRVTYSQLIEQFIYKVVHPEDRKHYFEVMQKDNFIQSLNNGIDRLGCEFRRIVDQNKMTWMELSVALFRDPVTDHVLGFISIKNIDAKKKEEARQAELESIVASTSFSDLKNESALISSNMCGHQAEEDFDAFIGHQGDIAYLVDTNTFELVSCNQAFYDRLGVSEAQCVGMKCYEAMHKRTTPCPFCSKANWSTDKFYLWKNLNLSLEQEFLIKNKLVLWQGRTVLLAIAVDLSNDKSIVDSMENSAMEGHSIISGVQRMLEASSLTMAMESGLESIGCFFRAERVYFWQYEEKSQSYSCAYHWERSGKDGSDEASVPMVSKWLNNRSWERSFMAENLEAMLGYSFDMYQYMKKHNTKNQKWSLVEERGEILGFISIDNVSGNFQNVAFLESFSTFLANEIKKRTLVESILYAECHDALTGLLARKSFESYMSMYKADLFSCIGVVMGNVNNLKRINSLRGFHVGNHYIRQFANMLREVFGEQNVYRLNGDEFLVIVEETIRSVLEAKVVQLENLIKENESFTVSLGHSWDDVERDLGVLIEQATQAMKISKKRHYDIVPEQADSERRTMLNELVSSIEKEEFVVFLQPKVELLHGKVVGAEALIRYNHKELGYILPSQFIDMLEKNNLIRYIDLFVFEQVCQLLHKWEEKGYRDYVISLNFSRLTLLERDIVSSMETIISRYNVSRENIEIEITESITGMGKGVLYRAAQNLYQAGFSLSLDDFGTKYTNLSVLADLNFSTLKIDKSLVGELGTQVNYQLIMKNIISMCRDLGIRVLAEGIEEQVQEDILRELECEYGQGYLYGKAMPIEEFNRKYRYVNID